MRTEEIEVQASFCRLIIKVIDKIRQYLIDCKLLFSNGVGRYRFSDTLVQRSAEFCNIRCRPAVLDSGTIYEVVTGPATGLTYTLTGLRYDKPVVRKRCTLLPKTADTRETDNIILPNYYRHNP